MPIIKNAHYTRNFALFDKTGLDYDNRLTWAAKGMLSYVLSKPEDWEVNVGDLVNRSVDGKTIVYNTLKELRHFGYVTYCEEKDATGQIKDWCYYVYATPEQNPNKEDPATLPLSKKHQGTDKRKKFPGGKRTKKPQAEKLNTLENRGKSPQAELLNVGENEKVRSEVQNSELLNTTKDNKSLELTNNNQADLQKIWNSVLEILEKRIKAEAFDAWFSTARLTGMNGKGPVIGTLDDVYVFRLKNAYDAILKETFQQVTGRSIETITYEVL